MNIVYGYAKQCKYLNDGTLTIQVRIPSIHGPFKQSDANGKTIKSYVNDKDLPYYNSVMLSHIPNDGDVVAVLFESAVNTSNSIVIGITGGSYTKGVKL